MTEWETKLRDFSSGTCHNDCCQENASLANAVDAALAEVERLRMWEEAGKEYLADRDEMRKTLERIVVGSMRLGALLERAELVIPPGPLSREIRAALGEEGKP